MNNSVLNLMRKNAGGKVYGIITKSKTGLAIETKTMLTINIRFFFKYSRANPTRLLKQ